MITSCLPLVASFRYLVPYAALCIYRLWFEREMSKRVKRHHLVTI